MTHWRAAEVRRAGSRPVRSRGEEGKEKKEEKAKKEKEEEKNTVG